jgi:hypothetical protein
MSKFGDEILNATTLSTRKEILWDFEYGGRTIEGSYIEITTMREGREVIVTIDDTDDLTEDEIDEIEEWVKDNI